MTNPATSSLIPTILENFTMAFTANIALLTSSARNATSSMASKVIAAATSDKKKCSEFAT